MNARTAAHHAAFVSALGGRVRGFSDVAMKPLEVDLALPLPRRIRLYLFSLVAGGVSRKNELKAVFRVPRQGKSDYGSFDTSDDRFVVAAGYSEIMNVFVLWDASLHERFKNGGNVQVREEAVVEAAAVGWSEHRRRLTSGKTEVVLACRSEHLGRTLSERVNLTGGE